MAGASGWKASTALLSCNPCLVQAACPANCSEEELTEKVSQLTSCGAAEAELGRSGRALQQVKTAGLLPTLLNSSLWLEADMKSLTGYGMRTLPTSIADATTPVNGEKARPDH